MTYLSLINFGTHSVSIGFLILNFMTSVCELQLYFKIKLRERNLLPLFVKEFRSFFGSGSYDDVKSGAKNTVTYLSKY